MQIKITIIMVAASFLLWACGGKVPEAKTAKDMVGGGDGTAAAMAPKRKISGEAKAEFNKAIKAYKQAEKTGINKSNCESLASEFADLYESFPKLLEAKFNEGVVWEECGELAKAEQAYQQLLGKHPQFGPALNNLGQIFFSKGQVSQAVTYFTRSADQKNSEGYANLAMIQRNRAIRGEPQLVKSAIDNIHRALAVDSFNIEAYGTMALILYDHAKTQSQLEMARLICVQATKVNDKYAPIYNILGLILLRTEKVTPALAEFRKAVALNPNYIEAMMNIGAITLSFRDYDSAEEAFTKVLSLNPDKDVKFDALVGLGVAFRGKRKFTEAMAKYQEAKKLNPANVDIVYNMGILIQDYTFTADDPATGIATLGKALNLLNQYASSGRDSKKVRDAKRRIKNINEMIPMLREQQKMMEQMKTTPSKG